MKNIIKHTKICLKQSKQNKKRIILVVYYFNIKETWETMKELMVKLKSKTINFHNAEK